MDRPGASVVTRIHERAQAAGELHHVLPPDQQRMSGRREVLVRRVAPHPPGVRVPALLLCAAVFLSSSLFWGFVWWDDPVRRVFFPKRGLPSAVMLALFAYGLWTQIITPLRLVRGLAERGRVLVALSLRAVLAWSATSLGTVIWWLVSADVSGWFAFLGGALVLPAWVLYSLVKAAVRADG